MISAGTLRGPSVDETTRMNSFVDRVEAALSRMGIDRDIDSISDTELLNNFTSKHVREISLAFEDSVPGQAIVESLLMVFVGHQLVLNAMGAPEEIVGDEAEKVFRAALAIGWVLGQTDHEIRDENDLETILDAPGDEAEGEPGTSGDYPSPASIGAEETGQSNSLPDCKG